MRKLFVIQRMSGLTDKEVYAARAKAVAEAEAAVGEKLEVIDQYIQENPPGGLYWPERERLWYLGHSIVLLGQTDYVICADEWWKAPGCCVEVFIANMYNIRILHEDINVYRLRKRVSDALMRMMCADNERSSRIRDVNVKAEMIEKEQQEGI